MKKVIVWIKERLFLVALILFGVIYLTVSGEWRVYTDPFVQVGAWFKAQFGGEDVSDEAEKDKEIVEEPVKKPEPIKPDKEDVSGGDVSGGDVSAGDVSTGDVSGSDVSGGDVSTNDAVKNTVSDSDAKPLGTESDEVLSEAIVPGEDTVTHQDTVNEVSGGDAVSNEDAGEADNTDVDATDNTDVDVVDNTDTDATDNTDADEADNTDVDATDNTDVDEADNTDVGATDNADEADNTDVDATDNMNAETVDDESEGRTEDGIVYKTVGEEYFEDALFIGDSRTVGMYEYGNLKDISTFYATNGLTIYKVLGATIVEMEGHNEKLTVEEALQERQFSKIYFMLGINEMGTGTVETFMDKYDQVIERIKELQPDATIYLQGIMKVTTKRSEKGDYIHNEGIEARNVEIAKLADNEQVFYLDMNSVVCEEDGGLTPAYTGDGVHLKAKYYSLWKDFLLEHAVDTF